MERETQATFCPCCGAEWRCEQEHTAICAEAGCEKPISVCCIANGHAKRCENCREWHCAEHLVRTDCGLLCGECRVETQNYCPFCGAPEPCAKTACLGALSAIAEYYEGQISGAA